MNLNVTFDQPQNSLPAGFVAAVNYVVNYYDSVFSNAVTVNIGIGYGEVGGQPLASGALGESQATGINQFSYSTVVSALQANEPSSNQQSAYAALPGTSPLGRGGTLWITPAEQKALGLMPANATSIDGYAGFSATDPFSYSPTATPGQNQFYFVGIVEHEISELMGRVSYIGDSIGGTNSFSIMDLFRWRGAGARQLTTQGPAYFSIDNGSTNLNNWNTDPSGDLGDWDSSTANDSYLAFTSAGTIDPVTPADLELMNIIGWNPSVPVVSGTVYVSAGQTSNGLTVLGGGALVVLSGGIASGTAVSASGADYVEAGGTADATVISSGGDEFVESGGTANGTIANGGSQIVYGTAAGTVLNSGARLYLESGTTIGTVVASGVELVYGTATSTTVAAAGFDFVFSGGTAIGTVLNGGEEFVEVGASAVGTVVNLSAQVIYGAATSTTINSGGFEYLEPGGSANSTVVNSGIDVIYGVAVATTVSSSGDDYVESGGTASATILNGGVEFVEIAAIAVNTTANSGTQVVYGTADGTVLNLDARLALEPGGSASGTLVNSGAELVYGTASATVLHSGGFDFIESGGTAAGTVVSGGAEFVEALGTASFTVVSAGAQVVYGTAIGTTLDSGSFQYVSNGGVASATQIDGGYEYVLPGGTVSGATISGGTLEMTSGAIDGSAPISFVTSGGGTLRLDDSRHFAGTVAGFGLPDQIDLADIAFGPGTGYVFQEAVNNTSGTLTVSSGTKAANLTLLGQYVAGQFHIATDTHGGTLVTDPPVAPAGDANPYPLAISYLA